jgi:phosphate transport system substrate-binding protein
LSYRSVRNRTGRFIKANSASVTAAAAGAAHSIPEDFRVSITDAPGKDAYPISSFTWLLVPSNSADPRKRTAIIGFLSWGLTKGQDLHEPLNYARLPNEVIAQENQALSKIKWWKADRTGGPNMAVSLEVNRDPAKSPHLLAAEVLARKWSLLERLC